MTDDGRLLVNIRPVFDQSMFDINGTTQEVFLCYRADGFYDFYHNGPGTGIGIRQQLAINGNEFTVVDNENLDIHGPDGFSGKPCLLIENNNIPMIEYYESLPGAVQSPYTGLVPVYSTMSFMVVVILTISVLWLVIWPFIRRVT